MKKISNTIEFEYEHFLLEVDYYWTKGDAGNYFNPPQPDEVDIEKVIIIGYINDDGNIEYLDTAVKFNMTQECQQQIVQAISDDVESLV